MPTSVGPNLSSESSLVYAFDTGDTVNSYLGEPTTNIVRHSNNVTGSNYGPVNEYSPSELVRTYYPDLITPIGKGATLCTQQAVNSYYHCLNWSYTSGETGKECLSAYIYPLTTGITNFDIGMVADGSNAIFFNLDTLEITYGAGISNRNAFITPVQGYPGWYRVGANIEGRVGGWVAGIGIGQNTQYTPTAPFKSFYICGLQYETNITDHCTQFVSANSSRSVSGSLLDVAGNRLTINCISASYNSSAQLTFSGSNYLFGTPTSKLITHTIEAVFRPTSHPNNYGCVVSDQYGSNVNYKLGYEGSSAMAGGFYNAGWRLSPTVTTTLNVWHHIVYTYDGAVLSIYKNGISGGSNASSVFPNADLINLRIGRRWDLADYFVGDIAIARIYNRALTIDEITNNFNELKSRFNFS